jgi:hypothetical protein
MDALFDNPYDFTWRNITINLPAEFYAQAMYRWKQ